jgi:hypothetical protein
VDEHRQVTTICLMRTADIADPRRAGLGRTRLSIAFVSPYVATATLVLGARRRPDDLGVTASSVTFNTYLDLFVMVGGRPYVNGREVWGVVYSFSDGLVD